MAERLNKRQADTSRSAIKTTQLLKRLQNHALGLNDENDNPVKLAATQIQAARICLDKSIPNLTATDLTTDGEPLPAYHFHSPPSE